MAMTYGDLRNLIDKENLMWQPPADKPNYVRLPLYAIGGSETGLVPTTGAPKFDLKTLGVSGNPHLAIRRTERGLISVDALKQVIPPIYFADSD